MDLTNALGAAQHMTLSNDTFFPIPVLCLVDNADGLQGARRIALRDPNQAGHPVLAIMTVTATETASDAQMATMTQEKSIVPKTHNTSGLQPLIIKVESSCRAPSRS